jgi:hypothetical protein
MRKFSIKKGQHFSKPRIWQLTRFDSVVAEAMFTSKSAYDCNDMHQWNKLCGISYSLDPSYNSAMIAWRYKDGLFELTPYLNFKGRWHVPEQSYKLGVNTPVKMSITVCNGVSYFTIGEEAWIEDAPDKHWFKTRRQPYFGGKFTPDNDIELYFDYL